MTENKNNNFDSTTHVHVDQIKNKFNQISNNSNNNNNNIGNNTVKIGSPKRFSRTFSTINNNSNINNNNTSLNNSNGSNNSNSVISDRIKFFQKKDDDVKYQQQQQSPITSSRHSRKSSTNSDSSNETNSFIKKPSNLNKPIQQPPINSNRPLPTQPSSLSIKTNVQPPILQKEKSNENFKSNGPKRSSRPLPTTPSLSRSTSVESNLSSNTTNSGTSHNIVNNIEKPINQKEIPEAFNLPPPPPQQQQQQQFKNELITENQPQTHPIIDHSNINDNNNNFEINQFPDHQLQHQDQQYLNTEYLHKDDFINEDYNQQQICLENLSMSNFNELDPQQTEESNENEYDYNNGMNGDSHCNYQEFENIDYKSFKKRPMDLDTETVLNAIEALEEYHRSPEAQFDHHNYEQNEDNINGGDLIDVSLLSSSNTTTNNSASSRNSIESNQSTSTSASSASTLNLKNQQQPISASSSSSSSSLTSGISSSSSGNSIGTKPKLKHANSQGTFINKSENNETQQKKILEELLTTEEDYLRDLDFIINDMVEPLSQKGIDKPTLMGVFSNIEIIRNVSKTIVDDLKSNTLNLHNFIMVFKKMSAFFKMYSQYCTHHEKSIKIIGDLVKNNSTFSTFKNEISSNPNSRGLSMLDYLIKPIQRICKYPLLFNELMRTTSKEDKDYEILSEVHGKLVEVAEFVNQCQHIKDNNERLLEIQQMIEGSPFTILESTRKILKECWVRIKEGKSDDTHNRYVLLFNDNIMFTKNSSFTKKYQFSFSLPYHSTKIQTSVKSTSLLLSGTNLDSITISIEMIFQDQSECDEVYQLLLGLIEKSKKQLETLKSRSSVLIPKNLSANTSPILKSTMSTSNLKSHGSLGKASGANLMTSPPFISKQLQQQQQQNQSHQALISLSKIMMEEEAKKRRSTLNPINNSDKNLNK